MEVPLEWQNRSIARETTLTRIYAALKKWENSSFKINLTLWGLFAIIASVKGQGLVVPPRLVTEIIT